MPGILTDAEIDRLIHEEKLLPEHPLGRSLKAKSGHKEREVDVTGADGSRFRIIVRQSVSNALDFSVILAYRQPNSNTLFRLRRYNGKSHQHTNKLEGNTFYDFHVHRATEQYQATGLREDAFAEPTSAYADLHSALDCMLRECSCQLPPDAQGTLF
jgi:hypothetical protein